MMVHDGELQNGVCLCTFSPDPGGLSVQSSGNLDDDDNDKK